MSRTFSSLARLPAWGGVATHHVFERQLQRSLIDLRSNHVPATLTTFVFTSSRFRRPAIDWLYTESRSLDSKCLLRNRIGQPVLLMLSPVTTATDMERFIERFQASLNDNHGVTLAEAGVAIHSHPLTSGDKAVRLLSQLIAKYHIRVSEVPNVAAHNLVRFSLGRPERVGSLEQ
jgi:hypothetical protein